MTTLESKFRTYDMRTQHPETGFAHLSEKAHKSTVWLARHLPQNRDLFMTGGGNGGFNLYKYHYPNSRTKNDKVRQACITPIERAVCAYCGCEVCGLEEAAIFAHSNIFCIRFVPASVDTIRVMW